MDPHRTSKAHKGETVDFVNPPHPDWKAGDKLPHRFGSDKYIDLLPEEIGNEMYPAIISSLCPRPIGFVCCLNSKGQRNLSPYSYCNAMHHDPPLVVLGSSRHGGRAGARKDMEEYVRETGYVVSVSSAFALYRQFCVRHLMTGAPCMHPFSVSEQLICELCMKRCAKAMHSPQICHICSRNSK